MLDDGCSGIKRVEVRERNESKTAAKNGKIFRLKNAIFSVNKYFHPPQEQQKAYKTNIYCNCCSIHLENARSCRRERAPEEAFEVTFWDERVQQRSMQPIFWLHIWASKRKDVEKATKIRFERFASIKLTHFCCFFSSLPLPLAVRASVMSRQSFCLCQSPVVGDTSLALHACESFSVSTRKESTNLLIFDKVAARSIRHCWLIDYRRVESAQEGSDLLCTETVASSASEAFLERMIQQGLERLSHIETRKSRSLTSSTNASPQLHSIPFNARLMMSSW